MAELSSSTTKGKLRQIEERLNGLEETIGILVYRRTPRAVKRSVEEIRKGKVQRITLMLMS